MMNRVYILLNPDSDDFTRLEGLQNKINSIKESGAAKTTPTYIGPGRNPAGPLKVETRWS